LVLENVTIPGRGSTLHGAVLDAIDDGEGEIRFVAVDSENTTLSVGDRLFLKFYRRLEDGTNPELEVGRHLAACDPPAPTPRLLGYLEQRFRVGEPRTIATLFAYVANEGSAAVQAREEVGRFVERILVESPTSGPEPIPNVPFVDLSVREPPASLAEHLGNFRANARLVGKRVAELHRALSSPSGNEAFGVEALGQMDQRSLYQSMRNVTGTTLRELRLARGKLGSESAALADAILAMGPTIYEFFGPLLTMRLTARRARIHGTLDLRNILSIGKDYVIVDLEGDRRRP